MRRELSFYFGDSCAATYTYPKTSALIFDKIIYYRKSGNKEIDRLLADNDICKYFFDTGLGSSYYEIDLYEDSLFYSIIYGVKITPVFTDYKMMLSSIKMMHSQPNHPGVNYTKFEEEQGNRLADEIQAYTLSVASLPQIDEKQLTWEHVIEFRKDKKSCEKVSKFQRWIVSDFIGKSKDEIEAILGQAFEDYKFALKKHGILTITGATTSLIAATPDIYKLIESGSFENAIGVGSVVSFELINCAVKQALNWRQTRRTPIALVYDVAKKIR